MHSRFALLGCLAILFLNPQAVLVPAAAAETRAVLRGTITDAATGEPAACTVAITAQDGAVVRESEAYRGGFRCGGAFEKNLAPGPTRVRIRRGPETRAETRELVLRAGETTTVSVALDRVADLRRRGWYAGDSHAHMVHGERTIPVDFDFVALSARAEDLQYFSVSHAWSIDDPTPEKLDAELARRSTPGCVLTWNLEAPKNYYKGDAGRCLGHGWSVGMRGRTAAGGDVIPLLLQASAGDYQSDKPTFANFESHALIRAQGGAAFYTHPARWWTGAWGGQGGYPRQEKMRVSNMAVELPLDTVLGPTYDGLDVLTSGGENAANDKASQLWSLLLNHGYRVAATASSDACFDRPGGAVPGSARTYTRLDGPFSLSAVARATAAGRTFATTGPLLLVDVDGHPPGSAFAADGGEHRMCIEVWASGGDETGLRQAEILRNGTTLRTVRFEPPVASWRTNLVVRETESAWYGVRVTGGAREGGRAVSGAFFFDPAPHRPPPPVACRVRVRVVDVADGRPLDATLVEVTDYASDAPRDGARHRIAGGSGTLEISGTVRLRAEAPGHGPLTLSPVFDDPEVVDAVTRLEDTDLLKWETFERMRELLGSLELTFRLPRAPR